MNKYKATKTVVDGVTFASRKEAARYRELSLLLRAGEITDLQLQPKFPIEVCGKKICTYIADFKYHEIGSPYETIEDVKGFKTPVYRLKKKLVEAVYGVEIVEI